MTRLRAAALCALVVTVAAAAGAAADESADLALRTRMWAIAERLDCPVCQGQSVRDSNAQLAAQMRAIILIRLQAGESEDQIMQFFADRYGPGVLREPPREGLALGVWLGPLVVVGFGVVLVAAVLARGRRRAAMPGGDLAAYEQIVDDLRRPRRGG